MVDWGKAAAGAGTGAAVGSAFGPWGTAIGAGGGFLLSMLGGGGDNAAPQAPPAQFAGGNGADLTNQLAAMQYSEGLQQQQAQNAREAAFYNQGNGNFDVANAAQGRASAQIATSPADQQRQLAALGATNASIGNLNSTGGLLTDIGTRAMGPSVAEAQLRLGQSDAMNQQLALARSGRSLGSGQAAMNQAAFNNAQINQTTNQQAAAARLQEQQNYQNMQLAALQGAGNAYGSAGNLAGQAGNQATTVRAGNENLQQQNAALQQSQQQINNQTTGLYNQLGAQQQQLGMQANQQGQNAYQFGQQQGQNMQTAQLNANLGQASSQTATNIANMNNANAHQAANMNMAASGFGAAADAVANASNGGAAAPAGDTGIASTSPKDSPYYNITASSNAAQSSQGNPGNNSSDRLSDERNKKNIKPIGLTSPTTDAKNAEKYAGFSPEAAAAYRAADQAAASGADTYTANGKTNVLRPYGDAPMDDQDLGKIGVTGEAQAPIAGYAETIAALNNAYRPSQFAPTDVLNRVPGAGAGHSASQDAVIAALSTKPGARPLVSTLGKTSDLGQGAFQGRARAPQTESPMALVNPNILAQRSMLSGAPAIGGAPSAAFLGGRPVTISSAPQPVAAPAPAWGDVFNAPALPANIAAYLNGANPSATPASGQMHYSGAAQDSAYAVPAPQAMNRGDDTESGGYFGNGQRLSDARSKTRIRALETQLAALSADAPPRDGETTRLTPSQEAGFAQWLKQNRVRDLDNPDSHYDYRGAYLGGVGRGADSGHFPDTYKQHGHPTFSVESQYSQNANDGGTWDGEQFSPALQLRAPDTTALDAAYAREQQAPAVDLRPAQGYSYEYKDPGAPGAAPGRHVGPMAQDLELTAAANAVRDTPRGKVVDTPALTMVNTAALSEQQKKMQDLERQLAALQGSGLGPMPAYDRSLYAQPGAF